MAPSSFSRVITWAGAPATRTGKQLMLVSVHLDYDLPLAFVQLNACNKPWGGKPENLFVKAALIQGYPPEKVKNHINTVIWPRRAAMSKSPFLQSVRTEIRTKQYSYRTEKSYLYWIRQFILFNDKKHPKVMGNHEIERFLNHLAVNRGVSPGTQNQALCAIIFVYKHVLKREIENLQYKMTKTPRRMPTVLSPR